MYDVCIPEQGSLGMRLVLLHSGASLVPRLSLGEGKSLGMRLLAGDIYWLSEQSTAVAYYVHTYPQLQEQIWRFFFFDLNCSSSVYCVPSKWLVVSDVPLTPGHICTVRRHPGKKIFYTERGERERWLPSVDNLFLHILSSLVLVTSPR